MEIQVPLHGGVLFAVIDAADYERVFSYDHHGQRLFFRICDLSWHSDAGGQKRRKRHTTYARTSVRRHGIKFSFRMHTLILGKRPGFVIDHDDFNGLNNRRSNLFHRTHRENVSRAPRRTRKTSEATQ